MIPFIGGTQSSQIHRPKQNRGYQGLGRGSWGVRRSWFTDTEFVWYDRTFWTQVVVMVTQHCEVLNATKFYTYSISGDNSKCAHSEHRDSREHDRGVVNMQAYQCLSTSPPEPGLERDQRASTGFVTLPSERAYSLRVLCPILCPARHQDLHPRPYSGQESASTS